MKQVALFEDARKGLAPEAVRLLANFEVVAEAPGGVKRLRELILELAVSGKLAGEECSHSDGTTVDSYVSFLNGYAFKSEWFVPEGVSVLRNVNVSHGSVRWEDVAQVSAARANEFERFALAEGDIVISLDRPIISTGVKVARVAQKDLPCLLLQRVAKVAVRDEQVLLPSFLFAWFSSSYFTGAIDPGRSKGVPHISTKQVGQISFKPPSIAGQHKSMRVLNSLMVFCDDLEARQTKQRETAGRLTKAALDALTSAEGPEELAASWQPVAATFEALLGKPGSVDDLRKSILKLAVRGRLVPRLTDNGAFGPPSSSNLDAAARLPFGLAPGWAYCTMEEGVDARLGKMLDHAKNRGNPYPYLRNTNVHWFRFELDDIKHICVTDEELEEYALRDGDVLVCEGGHGIGRTSVWHGSISPMLFQKALHRLRPRPFLDSQFIAIQLRVAADTGELEKYFTGAGIPHLTGRSLARFPLVVPPLAEQKRIVAKVDELMKLCDALEDALRRAEDTAKNLADALVAELLA